jgi:hypothetical protein
LQRQLLALLKRPATMPTFEAVHREAPGAARTSLGMGRNRMHPHAGNAAGPLLSAREGTPAQTGNLILPARW